MRTLAALSVIAALGACAAIRMEAARRCVPDSKDSWIVLEAPHAAKMDLLPLAVTDPGMPPVRGPDVWLVHLTGDIMLCRVNTRGGGFWIFRKDAEGWNVVDKQSWVIVS
jgi:hypothetical protein